MNDFIEKIKKAEKIRINHSEISEFLYLLLPDGIVIRHNDTDYKFSDESIEKATSWEAGVTSIYCDEIKNHIEIVMYANEKELLDLISGQKEKTFTDCTVSELISFVDEVNANEGTLFAMVDYPLELIKEHKIKTIHDARVISTFLNEDPVVKELKKLTADYGTELTLSELHEKIAEKNPVIDAVVKRGLAYVEFQTRPNMSLECQI